MAKVKATIETKEEASAKAAKASKTSAKTAKSTKKSKEAKEVKQSDQTQEKDFQESAKAAGEQAGKSVKAATETVKTTLNAFAPGHANAILFGVLALFVAILVFWVGFWQALFVGILVVAGVAFGQMLDGKPVIINTIKKLFTRK